MNTLVPNWGHVYHCSVLYQVQNISFEIPPSSLVLSFEETLCDHADPLDLESVSLRDFMRSQRPSARGWALLKLWPLLVFLPCFRAQGLVGDCTPVSSSSACQCSTYSENKPGASKTDNKAKCETAGDGKGFKWEAGTIYWSVPHGSEVRQLRHLHRAGRGWPSEGRPHDQVLHVQSLFSLLPRC